MFVSKAHFENDCLISQSTFSMYILPPFLHLNRKPLYEHRYRFLPQQRQSPLVISGAPKLMTDHYFDIMMIPSILMMLFRHSEHLYRFSYLTHNISVRQTWQVIFILQSKKKIPKRLCGFAKAIWLTQGKGSTGTKSTLLYAAVLSQADLSQAVF